LRLKPLNKIPVVAKPVEKIEEKAEPKMEERHPDEPDDCPF
jgi:hypothetical protein